MEENKEAADAAEERKRKEEEKAEDSEESCVSALDLNDQTVRRLPMGLRRIPPVEASTLSCLIEPIGAGDHLDGGGSEGPGRAFEGRRRGTDNAPDLRRGPSFSTEAHRPRHCQNPIHSTDCIFA
jgi:hypothetical protein